MPKRLLAAVLAALLTLSLAGCQKGGIIESDEEFQKNMHQSNTNELEDICETQDGFYFVLHERTGSHLYFMDRDGGAATILCAKPDCGHSDETCNADIGAWQLWTAGGRLYYTYFDYEEKNGQVVTRGLRLHSASTDGTRRKVVQELEFQPGGDTSPWQPQPILHRGVVYFPYSGVLYAVPLGGDIHKDATAIWGEENEAGTVEIGGVTVENTEYLGFTLWADGDFVYFMVDLDQPDGSRKDTLLAYDTRDKSVREVWRTPDADEVGEWMTTGVSVSQWYVIDGKIYFYLSGGDFWRSDLTTGETVKLADTHEKAAYGSAIFSDDYLCVLNDVPEDPCGTSYSFVGGNDYVGGDTIFVYGLDGSFKKELSLKALYDEFDTLTHCALAFCSGDSVYLVADAGTMSWSGGVGSKNSNDILFRVSIATGEITQIYNWE